MGPAEGKCQGGAAKATAHRGATERGTPQVRLGEAKRGPGSCRPAAPQPLEEAGRAQTPPSPGLATPMGRGSPGAGRGGPRKSPLWVAADPGSGRLRLREFVPRLPRERGQHRGRREGGSRRPRAGGQPRSAAPPRRFPRAASASPARPAPRSLAAGETCPQAQAQAGLRSRGPARRRQPPLLPAQVPGFAPRRTCPRIHVSSPPYSAFTFSSSPFLLFSSILCLSPRPTRRAAAGAAPRRRGWPGRCSAGPGEGVAGHLPAGKWGLGLAACLCVCAPGGREAWGPGGAGGGTMGRGRYKKGCGQGRGVMERGGVGPRGRR